MFRIFIKFCCISKRLPAKFISTTITDTIEQDKTALLNHISYFFLTDSAQKKFLNECGQNATFIRHLLHH